jgi:stearoyl-CoA desaturase (delta-9 desaturase)
MDHNFFKEIKMTSKTTNMVIFSIVLTLLSVFSFFYVQNFFLVFILWYLRAIGNGLIGHRYFAHNQFKVNDIVRKIFAYITVICAYSSPLYWKVQHLHHHRNSDKDCDIHSPKNGFLNSLFLWPFRIKKIDSVFSDRSAKVSLLKCLKDKNIKFTSNNFILINFLFLTVLFLLDKEIFFAWSCGYILENIKFGLINSITHVKYFPGNYRNHNLLDNSYNNIFLGFLTLGFGWHNNHHANSNKLVLTEKWWELDIEGICGVLLEKIFYRSQDGDKNGSPN